MSIITGILKDKTGNELRPLTNTAQVELTEGGQRLDAWISEVDLSVANALSIIDEDGKVKSTSLPDILNKFKGTFANEAALPESGEAGDYAICTDTDTVWIWDAEKDGGAGWIDSGQKGSVTSVNSKTGDVVIEISDIDGLQSAINAKVNTSDIVNNLSSEETDKPLAAAQGKALNDLVTAAQSAADSAASAASTAQTTANAAQTAASTAQTTADNAASAASTAQTTADNAASAASTAQTTADNAASAASAAQSTADTAVSNAATAQSAAEAAQSTANTAATNAATAQSTAAAAATTAAEIDFAIVENGAGAPTGLRDNGIYFEKDAEE